MFDAGGRPPSLAALTIPGKCPPVSLPFAASNSLCRKQSSVLVFPFTLPPPFFPPRMKPPTNPRSLFIGSLCQLDAIRVLQTRPSHVQLQKSGDEHPTSRNGKGWTGPVTLIGHELRGRGPSGTSVHAIHSNTRLHWGLAWAWAVRVAGETLVRIKWI